MTALSRRIGVAAVLVLAATSSGCQIRNYLSFGNEVAEPQPTGAAPRAERVIPVATPPAPLATAPIKTEDSVIFPQPRADQRAPQALQPALVVRADAGPVSARTDPAIAPLPMPQAEDPKVDPTLRALLTQASVALQRGQLARSGALFAKATDRAPFNPYALHGLAVTQARQGQFAKARSLAARSHFLNATDRKLSRANARLLEELDAALASRATGRRTRRR